MDKIIAPGLPEASSSATASSSKSEKATAVHESDQAEVNFQKASCTLDASVKIYSYRVDDVHLSSYKVLANLNRTDNDEDEDGEGGGKKKGRSER